MFSLFVLFFNNRNELICLGIVKGSVCLIYEFCKEFSVVRILFYLRGFFISLRFISTFIIIGYIKIKN